MGVAHVASLVAPQQLSAERGVIRALRRQTTAHSGRRWQSHRVSCSARKAKDPKDFNGDYDAIREYLEGGGEGGKWAGGFSFGTMLRTVSETSFGDAGAGLYKKVLELQERVVAPTSVNKPRTDYVKRNAIKRFGMTQVLKGQRVWEGLGYSTQEAEDLTIMTAEMAYKVRARVSTTIDLVECARRLDILAGALILTPSEVSKLVKACPCLLETDATQYMRNMVWLKQCLPTADVSKLLQNEPSLLVLSSSQRERVMGSLALLHKFLEGAPIDMMIEEDPKLLFEDLEGGLMQLRELWPEDVLHPTALSQSEPTHLVLAIRALSPHQAHLPAKW
eukprot:CAMPEP_0118935828 /NCGR_PEP_ID=MMETSP1169-20130426/15851_1 /TAXON_ID=36882 /ORGANISM="Pyramimonas obovata, Strain CCMP722" /LENGTH=333 /DNA_ID=CAMNT_0006878893 /DNA_START=72 /DNA_END=1073 /DNA_ORIENTATION=-